MPRQREFDQDKALEQAMFTFWKQGYEATSVRDLIASMSISSSSMYEVFGDKRGVYLAALAHYCELEQQSILESAQTAAHPKGFIETLFANLDHDIQSKTSQNRSFAFNAMVEFGITDPDVTRVLLKHYFRIVEIIAQLLEQAQTTGVITSKIPPLHLAHTILSTLEGIATVKGVKPDFEYHHAVAQVLIRLLEP